MKVLKWIALSLLCLIFMIWIFVYEVASGINEGTAYKEANFFYYYVLTDTDIKNCPKISSIYSFESQPGDGYSSSNAIIFQGVESIEPVRDYLLGLGYKREKRRLGESEIWTKAGVVDSNIFYLSLNKKTKEAELMKVFR